MLGFRDLVNMDETVWTFPMCNELEHLFQGWIKHAGTNKVLFIYKNINQRIEGKFI